MGKRSLDRKAAQKFIVENRENNKTDQEIYNELSLQYHDKKAIALLIMGTATIENMSRYKVYNSILLGLLVLVILLKILLVFNLTIETGQYWTLLLVFIVPIFAGGFAYEIAIYNAPIYRFCGILTILGFCQTLLKSGGGADIIINLAFAAAIAGLSFFLDSKLFPDYIPSNLRKDGNGEYILG